MKTKTLLFMCRLIGIGLTQVSAQKGKNGTGTVTGMYYNTPYDQPIILNGTLIDELVGTIQFHSVVHFKDGEPVWAKSVDIKSEAKSIFFPYEVFRVHEIDKSEWEVFCITWHFNLIGNMGSHYIGAVTWNFVTNETWFDKLVIVGSKK